MVYQLFKHILAIDDGWISVMCNCTYYYQLSIRQLTKTWIRFNDAVCINWNVALTAEKGLFITKSSVGRSPRSYVKLQANAYMLFWYNNTEQDISLPA